MKRILVAGGTGSLGSAVVIRLQAEGYRVRILSQRTRPPQLESSFEWAQGNVVTGEGLQQALVQVDIVVNCLGNPQNVFETDVLGVQRLAETAHTTGVQHFFHVSIVGIEQIELGYYQHKLSAENAVFQSGVSFSIQRITQFHTLLDFMMNTMQHENSRYTLPIASDAQFQLIDTRDVAHYITPLLSAPGGKLPDVGGLQILTVAEIATLYLQARGVTGFTLVDPEQGFFPPPAVEAFKQGLNTVPDNRFGQITWSDYVHQQYSRNLT